MSERGILEAVARADMWLCAVWALPWPRIGLSLLIAAVAVYVIRAVIRDGNRNV